MKQYLDKIKEKDYKMAPSLFNLHYLLVYKIDVHACITLSTKSIITCIIYTIDLI